MGLSAAISAALSGLRTTQFGMGLVADNVANAGTPGFVRKTLSQASNAGLGGAIGVRVVGINRELDLFVQRQLRAELAGGAYAGAVAGYYSRLDLVYGQPGGANALDTLFNRFTNSLQTLGVSPESGSARAQVLTEASVLAQQLNAMSRSIQEIRSETEISIGAAVNRINDILTNIERVSEQIASNSGGLEMAALRDTRDNLIAELSSLIDVRVVEFGHGQLAIFTNSGVSLYDHRASVLRFDGRDSLNAQSLWNANPAQRGVGTIFLTSPSGLEVDLIAEGSIRSGAVAAHIEMRDRLLVQAQAQLDEIAHSLAIALSNRTIAGTAAVNGAQAGFQLDLAALQSGNTLSLTYTDNVGGVQHRVTIVRVDDAAALPLGNNYTPETGDTVIGVNFAGGMGAVVAALNAALGPAGLSFDNPSGSVLRVLDDGAPDLVDVDAFSANVTTNTFTSGDPSLPFFVDGGTSGLYSGAIVAGMAQKLGFAARISLNPALRDDPSRLVAFSLTPPTAMGDPTRPDYLHQQLTAALRTFAPATGIGTAAGPFSGTIGDFVRQLVTFQGAASENAARLKEGQDIVVNALQARLADQARVNIDSEMANLLVLQTSYAANARVLTAIKDMLDALMRL